LQFRQIHRLSIRRLAAQDVQTFLRFCEKMFLCFTKKGSVPSIATLLLDKLRNPESRSEIPIRFLPREEWTAAGDRITWAARSKTIPQCYATHPFFGQLSERLVIGQFQPDNRAPPRFFNPKKRQLSF